MPQAVEGQPVGIHRVFDKGKPHEIVEADNNAQLFKLSDLACFVTGFVQLLIGRFQDVKPFVNETRILETVIVFGVADVEPAVDAAAIRMAKHQKMGNAKNSDRVFNGRRGAVMIAIRVERRDQVGNIAVNEELTTFTTKKGHGVNAAVTAGDNHGPGMLAHISKMLKPAPVFFIFKGTPSQIAFNKIGRKGTYVGLAHHGVVLIVLLLFFQVPGSDFCNLLSAPEDQAEGFLGMSRRPRTFSTMAA